MSIRFDCLSCSKNVVVHDRFEGRVIRCPACSFENTVPKKSAQSSGEDTVPAELVEPIQTFATSPLPSSESPPNPEAFAEIIDDAPVAVEIVEAESSNVAAAPPPPKGRSPRSIRGDHDEAEEDLEWDITPMVDVAFLLLIFFMLTASFSIQKVIRTTTPKSDQPSSNATQTETEVVVESLIVQVDEFNAFTVVSTDGETQEASSKQELIAILKDFRTQFGEQSPRIVIQAHVDSMHGAIVSCMDAAREAEFTKFQMFAVENFD